MEAFERHVYEKDINGIPFSYCGESLANESFYFIDKEHSKSSAKHGVAVCTNCHFSISAKSE